MTKSWDLTSAIIQDLVPQLETQFRAQADRDHRYIRGISMGGYGAARFALAYPDLFSKALLISPAVWHDINANSLLLSWSLFKDENAQLSQTQLHPESLLTNFKSKAYPLELIILSGEKDQVVAIEEVRLFVSKLKQTDKISVRDFYDKTGEHNWIYRQNAMKNGLKQLTQPKQLKPLTN